MKIKSIILSLVAIAILASCSTSNNVVGGGIQKRKYNDGYYVSHGKNYDRKSKVEETTPVSDEAIVDNANLNTPSTTSSSEKLNKHSLTALSEKELEFVYNNQQEIEVAENEESISIAEETETDNSSEAKLGQRIKKTFSTSAKALKNIEEQDASASSSADDMLILLIILCFFLPWLSVGIFTSWDLTLTLITLLLWFLFWLPGVIFGLLVLLGVI